MRRLISYIVGVTNELEPPREFDDYVLVRELERGGMGRVYVAEDAVLARPVAIKFLAHEPDAAARQRFLLEARAAAQIVHPNVVTVYRAGAVAGRPYLVTELIRGKSLAALPRPIASPAALDIAIGLARGLAAAHRCNVVHCDVKPGNVMIDDSGVAKIIDFGLARIAADGSAAPRAPVGTPDYMAPEVWLGEAPGRRADVYSLGALMFELLTGAPPFHDVPPGELAARVTTGEPPPLRERAADVDPAFADVIMRCLRREREPRFADGDQLREALERAHASRRHAVRAGENPYRGLLPFEASHRGVFFGRRSEIDMVVERLRAQPIVLVTGDSGVGKSSLCRAGVIPAVLDGELGGTWRALAIVPGRRPIGALAAALGDSGLTGALRETPGALARELRRRAGDHSLIVLIDQLEELITLGEPDEVAALDAGLAALADGVHGLRVLATVRADFLAGIAGLPGLGRELSRLLYFLRALPRERLRDVIVGPAAALGARFEHDDIVDELVGATAEAGTGGLPLLSFALADLWEARDRPTDTITRRTVAALGGVAGALARHADIVIGGMTAADRGHARAILSRLVTAQGTRARRGASELVLGEPAQTALDVLVSGRLVVVHDGEPEPVYEVAHECLLAGWPTLRRWLDADAAGRAIRERLAAAAAEWLRLGRRGDATWQGARLVEAAALDPTTITADQRAFVAASTRLARRRRWLRWAAAAGVVALIALAFTTQRCLAQRALAGEVDRELRLARDALADARAAAHERDRLAAQAFAAFDALHNDDGEQLWRAVIAARARAELAFTRARSHGDLALGKDPTRGDVRDLIGDVLLERAMFGERVHDAEPRDDLSARLAPYDADGSRLERWTEPGRLTVRAPAGAAIALDPGTPIARDKAVALAPGSYVVAVTAPGRAAVRAPVLVERGREIRLDIDPPLAADVPDGFIYVPAGEFLYGHAREEDRVTFFTTTPLRRRSTAAYLIARREVTLREWLAYVAALPDHERAARIQEAGGFGSFALRSAGDGRWAIELQPAELRYAAGWGEPLIYPGRTHHREQRWLELPVLGLSAEDATAYAAWLSREQVPNARLCSELEWERAARGADGRDYPTGRPLGRDDANIDVTHTREWMGPDEVGMHPESVSPFGLDDTVGNAFEWTISEERGFILRGGSYYHDRKTAHLTNRSPMSGSVRAAPLGFRLCATPRLPR